MLEDLRVEFEEYAKRVKEKARSEIEEVTLLHQTSLKSLKDAYNLEKKATSQTVTNLTDQLQEVQDTVTDHENEIMRLKTEKIEWQTKFAEVNNRMNGIMQLTSHCSNTNPN